MSTSVVSIAGINIAISRLNEGIIGQQPELVFLHDSLGSITTWGSFPETVCARLNMRGLVYDRQGHGMSDPLPTTYRASDYHFKEVEILVSLLSSLSIQQAVLFGHSDGGTIALLAAALYPDKIVGVISEAGHVFVEPKTIEGIIAAKEYYEQHKGLKSRLSKHHGDKATALLKAWTENWLRPEFRGWNIESHLQRINCPVLVIQGEEDEFATTSQVEAICSRVSGRSIPHVIGETGHIPHKTAEEEVVNAVEKFLANTLNSK